MKVICRDRLLFDGDLLTIGKEYEVEEVENGDYWIEDDNGNYNPFPQELFEVISK